MPSQLFTSTFPLYNPGGRSPARLRAAMIRKLSPQHKMHECWCSGEGTHPDGDRERQVPDDGGAKLRGPPCPVHARRSGRPVSGAGPPRAPLEQRPDLGAASLALLVFQ